MRQTFPGTKISSPDVREACSLQEALSKRASVPNTHEIRRRMAAIRQGWTDEERRQRAVSESSWQLIPFLLGVPSQPRSRRAFG
jgi:hypothetical protein